MRSKFATLTQQEEESGKSRQTTAILDFGPGAAHRLGMVAAVIREHFLNDDWDFRVRRGSLTFQHKQHLHQVVKVFIDKKNRLAESYNLSLHQDPIVIGIELATFPPYIRSVIRKDLRSRFPLYIEPKSGTDKLRIQPITNHHYDVLFLSEGPCPYEVDSALVEKLVIEIEQGIMQDDQDLDMP